jgi:hypothetical protein
VTRSELGGELEHSPTLPETARRLAGLDDAPDVPSLPEKLEEFGRLAVGSVNS